MEGMEENRKTHGWAWAAIALFVLPLAYPMSSGPAVAIWGATGGNRTLGAILDSIYYPLGEMPEPFSDMLEWWLELWDFYGVLK